MRTFFAPILVTTVLLACGGVDDAPLGGPFGGTTDQTDPNGGSNGDNGDSDSGTTQQDQDSGQQQQQQDSGQQQQQQKDAGQQQQQDAGQQQQQDAGQQQQTAPTWTTIFNAYLAGSKEGKCSQCHSQGSSAKNLYSWLSGKGYISGASSSLINKNQSCLSWYGGNMPPSGPNDAKAVSDMNAWAAAGAQNN